MFMKKMTKDQILTVIAVILLLFTAMINWNIYSLLVLVARILILFDGILGRVNNCALYMPSKVF